MRLRGERLAGPAVKEEVEEMKVLEAGVDLAATTFSTLLLGYPQPPLNCSQNAPFNPRCPNDTFDASDVENFRQVSGIASFHHSVHITPF